MVNLSQLFTLQFAIVSLGSYALVLAVKKLISGFAAQFAAGKLWKRTLLPLIPLVSGLLLALVLAPFPTLSLGGNLIAGTIAGMVSSHVYRLTKSLR